MGNDVNEPAHRFRWMRPAPEDCRPELGDGASTEEGHDNKDQEYYEKDVEKDLCDARGRARDAAESQRARDQRDDCKNNGPSKHDESFVYISGFEYRGPDYEVIQRCLI